jgi:hypothetical protein
MHRILIVFPFIFMKYEWCCDRNVNSITTGLTFLSIRKPKEKLIEFGSKNGNRVMFGNSSEFEPL